MIILKIILFNGVILNKLQYHLEKPWLFFLKKPRGFLLFCNKYLFFFLWPIDLIIYILLTALRFVNAVYYNLFIHAFWSVRDCWLEVWAPKLHGMRYRRGFKYFILWVVMFPYRVVRYFFESVIKVSEGLIFTIVDTFIPALTLYHGTKKESGISITKPGKWRVGDGNYAGSGIYFGFDKNVALHYAGHSSESVIILARVSRGRTINLNLTPSHIRQCVKYNGDKISEWAKSKGYTCTEWWRTDEAWWEYCLVHPRNGKFVKTWRIRILYVKNVQTGEVERIWGGKSYWLF